MSLACLLSHANQGKDFLPRLRTSPFASFSQGAATAGTHTDVRSRCSQWMRNALWTLKCLQPQATIFPLLLFIIMFFLCSFPFSFSFIPARHKWVWKRCLWEWHLPQHDWFLQLPLQSRFHPFPQQWLHRYVCKTANHQGKAVSCVSL